LIPPIDPAATFITNAHSERHTGLGVLPPGVCRTVCECVNLFHSFPHERLHSQRGFPVAPHAFFYLGNPAQTPLSFVICVPFLIEFLLTGISPLADGLGHFPSRHKKSPHGNVSRSFGPPPVLRFLLSKILLRGFGTQPGDFHVAMNG